MQDANKIIAYWSTHAQYDMDTAGSLFESKRYPYALFMCHLAIEKSLKAIIVMKKQAHAPYTHNLVNLAVTADLPLAPEQKTLIGELNEFNLEARYPDWKENFYSIATREYTEKYLLATRELFIWLTNSLPR